MGKHHNMYTAVDGLWTHDTSILATPTYAALLILIVNNVTY